MELMGYRKHIIISFILLMNIPNQLHGWSRPPLIVNTSSSGKHEIPVGVILDMRSSFGQMLHSCICIAISDFYSLNDEYNTRLVLHTRDSEGDPLRALTAAFDLLENLKVQAVIVAETSLEAKFLSILGDKIKVPVLLLTASPSIDSTAHRYLLQMTQDETIQWKGLAAIAESFKWKDVIPIHEDSESGRESVPYIIIYFQEKKVNIRYKSAISSSATDDQIVDELRKLSDLQERVFIIHVSHSLAFRVLAYAKRVGLMTQGYAWIVTDKTMNFLDPVEFDETNKKNKHSKYSPTHNSRLFAGSVELDGKVLESFQGALGLRYLIPSSNQLHNFTTRVRKESLFGNPNIFNILAYDSIFAIATAAEPIMAMDLTNMETGTTLLTELINVRFKGLSGEFHLVNMKFVAKQPLEIVNVIGKGERRVGVWTEDDGITMFLKGIIWPGGSMTPPRRLVLQKSKKLRIGVLVAHGFEEFLTIEHNHGTNAIVAKGLCVDVFNAALEALPYDVPYEFVDPLSFQDRNNPKTYDDHVSDVYLQNYDALIGDITITASRSLYVEFTIPYTDVGLGTVARNDYNRRNMWWFLEPLDTSLWVALTCSFFIIGATTWLIESPINPMFQGPWQDVVGHALWFSFSTLTFSQRGTLFSNFSRFLVISWLFIVLIMLACYSAALSSMLTVQQIELNRRGIDIGYHSGSFIEGVIINNSNLNDPSLKPYNSSAEYARGLAGGSKKDGVVAIMDEFPYIKLFLAKYGSVHRLISYEPSTNGFGFVFQKGSPLVPDISREILKLREEGKLLKMEKKWFKKDSSFLPDDSQQVPTILTFHNFRGLFLIGGVILAFILLVFLLRYVYRYSFLIYYILIDPRLALQLLNLI